MAEELTKALLLEEAVSPGAIADALFASVAGSVPLVQALIEAGAATPDVLGRYLARTDAPFVRQVAPVHELVDAVPPGLCERLFAIPIRRDAITGTVDVAVADANDPHAARELAFHLRAPIRVIRAPIAAIEEGLRRIRVRSLPAPAPPPAPAPSLRPAYAAPASNAGPPSHRLSRPPAPAFFPEREAGRARRDTPPWGTPVHGARASSPESEGPKSGLGSEIPIPLTRKTFTVERGGTQRPPPIRHASDTPMGEGMPVDIASFRTVVEVRQTPDASAPIPESRPLGSYIPSPPRVPSVGGFAAYAPQLEAALPGPFLPAPSRAPPPAPAPIRADVGGILAALRIAGSRDEILDLVLMGARMLAVKVALFVVKRGGYLGWSCTPELGDRGALQGVLVPLESQSVFDSAVQDGVYLGPIRQDDVHAGLLHVMRGATRDVAVVPIRVIGKTAVVILADELGDTMIGTRRLEEIARAAGEAFARIVRSRR